MVLMPLTMVLLAVGCAPSEPAALRDASAAAQPASVQGRLVYSNRQPVSMVPVVLRDLDEERPEHNVMTDEEGRFAFEGLRQGSYRLFEIRVYVDGGRGRCEVLERREIDVNRPRVDLGELELKRRTIMPVGD
jgi:hypothetical protein